MSPVKGQNVKHALQYNSQLRNMSDTHFMRHLGWLETGANREKRPSQHVQQSTFTAPVSASGKQDLGTNN